MESTLSLNICLLILMLPGFFFYIMNWAIYIHNKRGKKWVSNVPPLGGLIIAAVFLLTPYKLLALIGLTDPGLWLMLTAVIMMIKDRRKSSDNTDDKH